MSHQWIGEELSSGLVGKVCIDCGIEIPDLEGAGVKTNRERLASLEATGCKEKEAAG